MSTREIVGWEVDTSPLTLGEIRSVSFWLIMVTIAIRVGIGAAIHDGSMVVELNPFVEWLIHSVGWGGITVLATVTWIVVYESWEYLAAQWPGSPVETFAAVVMVLVAILAISNTLWDATVAQTAMGLGHSFDMWNAVAVAYGVSFVTGSWYVVRRRL